jgi:hypothetical protein
VREVLAEASYDTARFRTAWLARCAGDEAAAHDMLWRSVAELWDHVPVSAFLATGTLTIEHAKLVAAHLMGDKPEEGWQVILDGWSEALDTLVFACYRAAPSAFRKVADAGQQWATRGLALVRRRVGEMIEPSTAHDLVTALAELWVRGRMRGTRLRIVDEGGAERVLELTDVAHAGMLALRVDPDVDWKTTLERAVREYPWARFADIAPIVEVAPLQLLAVALANGQRGDLAGPLSVLDRRDDPPQSLLDAARNAVPATSEELSPREFEHQELRRRSAQTVLAIAGVERSLRQGASAPDDLEQLVTFRHAAADRDGALRLIGVLQLLPAARVDAWARARLADDGAAVLAFAALEDATFVLDVLRDGGPIEPTWFEVLGARAIAPLLAAANALRGERAAIARHAFVFAVAAAVSSGTTVDPAWDIELLVAAFEDRPIERAPYGDQLRGATERVLAAIPRERREVILTEAFGPAPMSVVRMLPTIEDDDELDGYLRRAILRGMIDAYAIRLLGARALPALAACGPAARDPAWIRQQAEEALPPEQFATIAAAFETTRGLRWQTIADEAATARAALPAAPCKRIYLLRSASFTWPARDGSRSRLGGRPPAGARTPSGMFHLMTIDLAEVPELAAYYPQARALAVFCTHLTDETQDPEVDAELIELSSLEASGGTLAIFALDVPDAVFSAREHLEPPLRAIRDRIDHADGYLLGAPIWITGKPHQGADEGFIGRIGESLDGRLNFGDGGALYLFTDATIYVGL